MTNYGDGKIYKLISEHTDKIYVGSTCKTLHKRLIKHKGHYVEFCNGKKKRVAMSKNLFALGDVDIVLMEDFPCKTKEELTKRERYWIEENKDMCLNIVIPQRTQKEYYDAHKEKYYERNKKYYAADKAKFAKRSKLYREKNKDTIKAKESIKSKCDCGGKYSPKHKARHMKTKKHIEWIE